MLFFYFYFQNLYKFQNILKIHQDHYLIQMQMLIENYNLDLIYQSQLIFLHITENL